MLAMFIRRIKVFTREPRQWFLIFSPFINVMTFFLILCSLFSLTLDSQMSTKKKFFINFLVSALFPFFLNFGYASSCGVYLLMPIEERQSKMKHILTMTGMRVYAYWIGLFVADFFLFTLPTILFSFFVAMINLDGFS